MPWLILGMTGPIDPSGRGVAWEDTDPCEEGDGVVVVAVVAAGAAAGLGFGQRVDPTEVVRPGLMRSAAEALVAGQRRVGRRLA